MTDGIAQGTRASGRTSHWNRSPALSSRASPRARKNWRIVTEKAQIRPILKEFQKTSSWSSRA